MSEHVAAGQISRGKLSMVIDERLVSAAFEITLRFHLVDDARPPSWQNVLLVDVLGEWYEGRYDADTNRWVYADSTPFADGLISAWSYLPSQKELISAMNGGE